jgi:hypothetical protein
MVTYADTPFAAYCYITVYLSKRKGKYELLVIRNSLVYFHIIIILKNFNIGLAH